MSPFDRAHTTSYRRSIVTMALSPVVSEIFNVEKCLDLEIKVRGHSRSLKVIPFDRLDMVSYWCSTVTYDVVSVTVVQRQTKGDCRERTLADVLLCTGLRNVDTPPWIPASE